MRGRSISIAVVAMLMALVIGQGMRSDIQVGGVSAATYAQQATPVPDAIQEATGRLPEGIDVALLAGAELSGLPVSGLMLELDRVWLAHDQVVEEQAEGPILIAIESGAVTVETARGRRTLTGGGQALVQDGERYSILAVDGGDAVALRFMLSASTPIAPANATPMATPVVDAATPIVQPVTGLVSSQLFSGDAGRLDNRRGTAFIARVTIPAGTETATQFFSGPVGVFVEAGTLRVDAGQIADLTLQTGQSAILPGFVEFNASNPTAAPAVILVAGLLAPPIGGAIGPTPTPEFDDLATAEAQVEVLTENLATLGTREAELSRTVVAQQTTIEEHRAALATAEAELTVLAADADAQIATAQAELTVLAADADAQIATAQAELTVLAGDAVARAATAEAELGSAQAQVSELEAMQAAIQADLEAATDTAAATQDELEAVTAALAEAEAAATAVVVAAADTEVSLEATIVALQTERDAGVAALDAAEAEAADVEQTVVALQTANAELAAEQAETEAMLTAVEAAAIVSVNEAATAVAIVEQTIEVQAAEIAAGEALVEAQATEIAAANETVTAQAEAAEAAAAERDAIVAAAEATAQAYETALAEAVATTEEIAATAAEAEAAAIARSEAAAATIEAQQAALVEAQVEVTALAEAQAAQQTEIEILEAEVAAATAIIVAQEAEAADLTAALEARDTDVEAVRATVAAQETIVAEIEASLAQTEGEVAAAAATIVALETARAETEMLAVAAVNPDFVELSIQVDLDGLIARAGPALEAAEAALEDAMAPFEGCRAGVVLTFGHGRTIGQGTQLAAVVNGIIQANYPEIFDGAAFDAFGDLNPPLGQVDVRIYFFTGCPAAEVEI